VFTFERVPWDDAPGEELDSFPDRTVAQTLPWLEFVRRTQQAEPVILRIREGAAVVGYFTGLITTKLGMRMLGSPFPGWTSMYMGFNLAPGVARGAVLRALREVAFGELGCVHMEVMDRYLSIEDGPGPEFEHRLYESLEIDLRQSEDELLAGIKPRYRTYVRQAAKRGVTIEEAHDADGFADDYYLHLTDVFAKQSRVPLYGPERVRALIDCLLPSGRLLLLRAREPGGTCIATLITPAMNRTMYYWGAASLRQYQSLRPNEPLMWYAMRYWKNRGIQFCDMVEDWPYKRKFGGYPITCPWFRTSKYPGLAVLRNAVRRTLILKQSVSSYLRAKVPAGRGSG
jgi:hypothetical protein